MKRSDRINILLAATTCIAGHAAPVATLLASYAVLGPAHYLTEVSWLHDRHYFVDRKLSWCALALVPLALIYVVFTVHPVGCAALICALSVAISAAFALPAPMIALVATLSTGAALLALQARLPIVLALAVLVPTIIHVFGFTTAFVVRGARGSGGIAWSVPFALAAAALSFILIPSAPLAPTRWLDQALAAFGQPAAYLSHLPFHPTLSGVIGFLGFAYAFHYLNWFGKTASIGWHRMSVNRAMLLVATWLTISAAYLKSFQFGLALSLPLSIGHVFLELPLNASTLRSLARRNPSGSAERTEGAARAS